MGRRVNYFNTFIAAAADSIAKVGSVPPERPGKQSVAALEYELIAAKPYALTQEEVQFAVHVRRLELPAEQLKTRHTELWEQFFSRPMACMRASALPKRYGWGLHFNAEGKVTLVAVESSRYSALSGDGTVEHTRAMRSRRP